MKRILMILFFCASTTSIIKAQKTKVTPAAEKAFNQKFPNAKEIKWEKEGKNEFEANFIIEGKKGSANFSNEGEWMETEMSISPSSLPKAVIDNFNQSFPGATIKDVYKIESKKGNNYFEIEYSLKGKNKEAKLDTTGKIM